jgi:DNA invertase Pin-like site-specific DNA recombinase
MAVSDRSLTSSTVQTYGKDRTIRRVALYARVSTSNGQQNPEMQLAELREYSQLRGWDVAGEYADCGLSGVNSNRPELKRLMSAAHRRKFDAVLVWKIDRFGRSLNHLVNALAELEAKHVAFVSLRDNIDLSTPAGRLMFHVIAAMAEFERSLIQERVKTGMQRARNRGKHVGRPRTLNVDMKLLRAMRAVGFSWRRIGRELNISRTSACDYGRQL